jgi:hypothetical protein
VKEEEATKRFMDNFGPVTAVRALGYAWKLDTAGEDWLRENISRQQLNHIRELFKVARVPFEPGAIEWPRLMRSVKRAKDNAEARKAALNAENARRGPRTA